MLLRGQFVHAGALNQRRTTVAGAVDGRRDGEGTWAWQTPVGTE